MVTLNNTWSRTSQGAPGAPKNMETDLYGVFKYVSVVLLYMLIITHWCIITQSMLDYKCLRVYNAEAVCQLLSAVSSPPLPLST